jgi:nicotinate-nucleotide adenylyltransferase
MRRLGLLGGTFDPVHYGHLLLAERAREACGLNEVLFVCAGQPAYKLSTVVAPAADRLAMLELACADNPAFSVSRIEVERPGTTYTVDTLEELHKQLGSEVELCFICGSDSARQMPEWKDAARIAELCTVLLASRPASERVDVRFSRIFAVEPFVMPARDISSSDIRNRLGHGESTRYLLPPAVEAYAREHRLYDYQR